MRYHPGEYEQTIAKWQSITGTGSMLSQVYGSIKWRTHVAFNNVEFEIRIYLN